MYLETFCREYRLPLQVTISTRGWVATIRGAEVVSKGIRSTVLGTGETPDTALKDLATHLSGAAIHLGRGERSIPLPIFTL